MLFSSVPHDFVLKIACTGHQPIIPDIKGTIPINGRSTNQRLTAVTAEISRRNHALINVMPIIILAVRSIALIFCNGLLCCKDLSINCTISYLPLSGTVRIKFPLYKESEAYDYYVDYLETREPEHTTP